MTADTAVLVPSAPMVGDYEGDVIVEWPSGHRCGNSKPGVPAPLPGWGVTIRDARTEDRITCVQRFALYASASDVIWMRAECLTGEDGKPLRDGEQPATRPGCAHGTDEVGSPLHELDFATGIFSFRVAAMHTA